MPAAQGLFHRAVAQSGSAVTSMTAARGDAARGRVDVAARPENVAARGASEAAGRTGARGDAAARAAGRGGFVTSPVVDGASLPRDVFNPAATPLSATIPLLIGSTETEVTWSPNTDYAEPPDAAALRDRVARNLRVDAGARADAGRRLPRRPAAREPARSRADHRNRRLAIPHRGRIYKRSARARRRCTAPGIHVPLPVVLAGQRRTAAGDALHGHPVRLRQRRQQPVDRRRRAPIGSRLPTG